MRKIFFGVLLFAATMAYAQQNTSYREGQIVSPVVHDDGTVTFRVSAPRATQVDVCGDWEYNGGVGHMTLSADSVWEYTTPVLPSEMYTYRIVIDGVWGLDPTNPFTRRDVGTQFSVFFVSGGVADLYQVQDVPHGSLSTVWYDSKEAGMPRRLSVYTPAGYMEGDARYPVLYLLHGSGGDETAWVELGNVVRVMDNMIASGRVRPMMVVMPNGNFSVPAAPGETSANLSFRPVMSNRIPGNYKNGKYEMSFDEIVSYVDSHYRTLSTKENRAIAGLSMGGFHTLFIALNHPDMFHYVGLMSAGLGNQYLTEDIPAYADYQGKLQRLKSSHPGLFWIAIGKDDFLYQANADFRAQLDGIGMSYLYHESTRGHLWCNWRQYLVMLTDMLWK